MKKSSLLLTLIFFILLIPGCTQKAGKKQDSEKKYKINLVHFSELYAKSFEEKLKNGMNSIGLTEGKEYELRTLSAQNDMVTLNSIIDVVINDKPDLVVIFHAQPVYAAINKIKDIPILFSIVSDPFILGAGNSDSLHLPNVTGMYYIPPTAVLIEAISKCRPQPKKIGIVFQTGDIESTFQKENIVTTAQKYNIEVEAVGFTNIAEIQESVNALVNKKVDGIMMNYDSYYSIIFPILSRKCQERKIPFFAYGHYDDLNQGATIIAGKHTVRTEQYFAEMIKRILNGEEPGKIPFVSNREDKSALFINLPQAKATGLTIPEELIAKAEKTINE
ncbi:MAG: ABC transporter substrate-binding protein [Mangrovibacterium sp.]